jgi:hypothetical protein
MTNMIELAIGPEGSAWVDLEALLAPLRLVQDNTESG